MPIHDDWRTRFVRRLWYTDLVVLSIVVFGAQLVWFGPGNVSVVTRRDHRFDDLSYWVVSLLLVVVWMGALGLVDSRRDRVIGTGMTEYVRVVSASLRVFGAVAIISFLLQLEVARGYLLISLPVGVLLLLTERALWRHWLMVRRRRGEYSAKVLLVGSESSVAHIANELRRIPHAGYQVVGACVPTGTVGGTVVGTDIPILGSVDAVDVAMTATGADTVAVTSTDELSAEKVKQISWDLEAGRQHLVLAPSIADIAGPRIHTRPVAGLPLIHVETPRFSRGQLFGKRILDLGAACAGVILLLPLLLVLATAIRLTSDGPVFFHQIRIGRGGREFRMVKFRSMVVDAEDLLPEIDTARRQHGNEVLFKMKGDPRVTPLGRFMRKYSLDELPQLFNVIHGSMSLVGPRPPLPREVAQYATHVHRRFLVKPGITGLWQVSGRSMLSWEESVRLDLSYVENWTLIGDLGILAKTAKAVLAPGDTAH